MIRFRKTNSDLVPLMFEPVELPDIVIFQTTAHKGTKGLFNYSTPIKEMHGDGSNSMEIERTVLQNMKSQADALSDLISERLSEIPA